MIPSPRPIPHWRVSINLWLCCQCSAWRRCLSGHLVLKKSVMKKFWKKSSSKAFRVRPRWYSNLLPLDPSFNPASSGSWRNINASDAEERGCAFQEKVRSSSKYKTTLYYARNVFQDGSRHCDWRQYPHISRSFEAKTLTTILVGSGPPSMFIRARPLRNRPSATYADSASFGQVCLKQSHRHTQCLFMTNHRTVQNTT